MKLHPLRNVKSLFAGVGEAKPQSRELFIASGFLQVNCSKSFLKIKRGMKKLRRLRRTGNFLVIESVVFRHAFWSLIASGLRVPPTDHFYLNKKNYVNLQNSSRRGSDSSIVDVHQCHHSGPAAENDTRSHPFYIPTAGDWKQFLWR